MSPTKGFSKLQTRVSDITVMPSCMLRAWHIRFLCMAVFLCAHEHYYHMWSHESGRFKQRVSNFTTSQYLVAIPSKVDMSIFLIDDNWSLAELGQWRSHPSHLSANQWYGKINWLVTMGTRTMSPAACLPGSQVYISSAVRRQCQSLPPSRRLSA